MEAAETERWMPTAIFLYFFIMSRAAPRTPLRIGYSMAFAQSLRPVPPSFPMAGADRYTVVQPLSHLALSHSKSRTTVLSSRKPQRKGNFSS
ncbi:hypothetical protein HPP92_025647 [Vanilla planifolia]|uniref:Uncharacterized protein n=1 Tax=Vanilla planifolia TaxID=51239 RepID=A0A835PIW2_VANPL|nr:hypothetical protein HPP92_025904 [Vanilla planifolia]KAG0454343.1 hypothetical protein HPP92_025647 [Vanilla planifolia]